FDALESALISSYKKNFGSSQNVLVEMNRDTGAVRVYATKDVVSADSIEDPLLQISLEEARQIDPAYELGEVVKIEITPRDFGRIAAQTAKQVVIQRIKDA